MMAALAGWWTRCARRRQRCPRYPSPPRRIPPPAFQVACLPGYETWMTGTLVYSEAFWALDCVGLRDESARVPGAAS
jgi:putative acetyltransferase